MSTSPIYNQTDDTTNIQASTPVLDHPNLPLLFKYNEEHNAMISHLDENNENDAV